MLVFWSIWRQEKILLRLTDLYALPQDFSGRWLHVLKFFSDYISYLVIYLPMTLSFLRRKNPGKILYFSSSRIGQNTRIIDFVLYCIFICTRTSWEVLASYRCHIFVLIGNNKFRFYTLLMQQIFLRGHFSQRQAKMEMVKIQNSDCSYWVWSTPCVSLDSNVK